MTMKKPFKMMRKSVTPDQEDSEAFVVQTAQTEELIAPATSEEPTGAPTHEPIAEGDTDEGDGTVRLSCDLRRSHHRALRVAAAVCDRTIVDMVEVLIERHLLLADSIRIKNNYHNWRGSVRSK